MSKSPAKSRASRHFLRWHVVVVLLLGGLIAILVVRDKAGGNSSVLPRQEARLGHEGRSLERRADMVFPTRRAGSATASTSYPVRRCAEENAGGMAMAVPLDKIPAVLAGISSSKLGSPYAEALAGRWAQMAPEAAAAWLTTIVDPGGQEVLAGTIAAEWAGKDWQRALEWADGLASRPASAKAHEAIALALVRENPGQAMEIAARLDKPWLMCECAGEWARVDPAAASSWCAGLHVGKTRDAVACEVASAWGEIDPVAAASFAATGIHDASSMDRAVLAILGRADAAHRPELAEWVESFPEGSLKYRAKAELTRIYHLLPSSPANMPGEDVEDRSPHTATVP